MNRSRATTWSLTAAAFLLVLGVPSAIAKPKIASGSQCSANWVNNAGAMQCFIQHADNATEAGGVLLGRHLLEMSRR